MTGESTGGRRGVKPDGRLTGRKAGGRGTGGEGAGAPPTGLTGRPRATARGKTAGRHDEEQGAAVRGGPRGKGTGAAGTRAATGPGRGEKKGGRGHRRRRCSVSGAHPTGPRVGDAGETRRATRAARGTGAGPSRAREGPAGAARWRKPKRDRESGGGRGSAGPSMPKRKGPARQSGARPAGARAPELTAGIREHGEGGARDKSGEDAGRARRTRAAKPGRGGPKLRAGPRPPCTAGGDRALE